MNYLDVEQISKSFGDKLVFDNISLQISKGDKIAIVAKNGSGKTTLMRVLAGKEAPEGEHAKYLINRHIRLGYLEQDPSFHEDATVYDAVYESEDPLIKLVRKYHELLLIPDRSEELDSVIQKMEDNKAWDLEARIKEILFKLNITNLEQKTRSLSGGQLKRLALAKLVIEAPEFIFLDEPTNHLDLDMIEWLEKYLQRQQLTLLMVTHDRYFLERVCNVIIELDRGQLYKYQGNYSVFLEKKASRMENEAANLEKTKKLYKKELDWIRRQPKARGTKAKSRVGEFYKIKEAAHKNLDEGAIHLQVKGRRLGSKIVELHNVSKSFDDKKIIEGFSYKFKKNERVGIVGPNGAGKSTFINLVTKSLRPDSGKVVVGDTVAFGYVMQDGLKLDQDKPMIEVIRDIAEYIPLDKGQKLTAPQLLERFLFPRSQHRVFVSKLSGGERRRLYLLTVLMSDPNFLILDEPTNDLDILTLNVLEDFLKAFQGCQLIVSHDRYFMDKLVDHLFILNGDGSIKDYNGNYSTYRAQQSHLLKQKNKVKSEGGQRIEAKQPLDNKRKLSYLEKKEIEDLEKAIDQLQMRKEEINGQFLSGNMNNEEIVERSKELGEIEKNIEEKEERWLELSEFL